MKIKDLSKAQELKSQLSQAVRKHKATMSLTESGGGNWNLDSRAYISLGGDHYGNGTMHKLELTIKDSPELVRVCRKLQADAWGKVVSLRYQLRSYGIDIDSEG